MGLADWIASALDALLARNEAIAARFREQLQRVADGPSTGAAAPSVPPSDVPDVAVLTRWVLTSVPRKQQISESVEAALEALTRFGHLHGLGIDQFIVELRTLERLVYDALRGEVSRPERPVPAGGVWVACLRVHVAMSVLQARALARYAAILQEGVRDAGSFAGGRGAVGAADRARRSPTRALEAGGPAYEEQRGDAALFVDTLDHELRGPLQAAMSAAAVLEAQLERQDALPRGSVEARALEQLGRSLRRIGELFGVAREVSLQRDPARQREWRWQRLAEILEVLHADLREMAVRNAVTLVLLPVEPSIWVAAGHVEVILRNLIANAIKYSDSRKATRWVQVRASPAAGDPPRLSIGVQDNGVGIAPADLGRIFTRSFRAVSGGGAGNGVPDGESRGLGLAIARDAAEQIGASIEVESEVDRGSSFTLCLPDDVWQRRSA